MANTNLLVSEASKSKIEFQKVKNLSPIVREKSDPNNGHPFWRKTAQELVDAITASRSQMGDIWAAKRPSDTIASMTPAQLREEAKSGKLPNMYPWDDDVWAGIKMHVARRAEELYKEHVDSMRETALKT